MATLQWYQKTCVVNRCVIGITDMFSTLLNGVLDYVEIWVIKACCASCSRRTRVCFVEKIKIDLFEWFRDLLDLQQYVTWLFFLFPSTDPKLTQLLDSPIKLLQFHQSWHLGKRNAYAFQTQRLVAAPHFQIQNPALELSHVVMSWSDDIFLRLRLISVCVNVSEDML